MSSRLHAYRVRRHGAAVADLQPSLQFEDASPSSVQISLPEHMTETGAQADRDAAELRNSSVSGRQRKTHSERFEISISETPWVSAHAHQPGSAQQHTGSAPDALFPVASLPERRLAALFDAAFLLFSFGGMLALFTTLGGRLDFNRLDAMVTGATLGLFYAQYFALFTIFGGSTPGMMLRRIRVVSFDGSVPTSRQMAWRSFGYLISAATCFLGFLWALWDEDDLCWQDRISQTYLTPIDGFAMPQAPIEDSYKSAKQSR